MKRIENFTISDMRKIINDYIDGPGKELNIALSAEKIDSIILQAIELDNEANHVIEIDIGDGDDTFLGVGLTYISGRFSENFDINFDSIDEQFEEISKSISR